jgi:hypothetical protein
MTAKYLAELTISAVLEIGRSFLDSRHYGLMMYSSCHNHYLSNSHLRYLEDAVQGCGRRLHKFSSNLRVSPGFYHLSHIRIVLWFQTHPYSITRSSVPALGSCVFTTRIAGPRKDAREDTTIPRIILLLKGNKTGAYNRSSCFDMYWACDIGGMAYDIRNMKL